MGLLGNRLDVPIRPIHDWRMKSPAATTAAWRTGLLTLLATTACPALAGDEITEARAVTTAAPPFVMEQGGQLTG